MRLAVCLISCGRHDLTARCVDSFVRHNPAGDPRLVLLQADEPALGVASAEAGSAAGFRLAWAPPARGGQMQALRVLVGAAQAASSSHLLWLENDWETVAPLPWDQIGAAQTVRLYGAWKRPGEIAAGERLIGAKTPIAWSAAGDGWERGAAHWAAGASIIRTDILARQLGQPSLKAVMKVTEPLDSLRPAGNIMISMGAPTTEGFIP